MLSNILEFLSPRNMMDSITAAFSGVGRKFTQLCMSTRGFHPICDVLLTTSLVFNDSYTVSEGRRVTSNHGLASQNVAKLAPLWVGFRLQPSQADNLSSIHETSQKFAAAVKNILENGQRFYAEASPEEIQQLSRQLEPMTLGLIDNSDELQAAQPGQWPGLAMFWLRALNRISGFLDVMYHLPTMSRLRDQHDQIVPPSFIHENGLIFDQNMQTTKRVLSDPALRDVLPGIMASWGMTPNQAPMSVPFMRRVILDIDALDNRLTPPTYVVPGHYHETMSTRFPPPSWLPKGDPPRGLLSSTEMPGMFPGDTSSPLQQGVSPRPPLTGSSEADGPTQRTGRGGIPRPRQSAQDQTAMESLSRVSRGKVDKRASLHPRVGPTTLSMQRNLGGLQTYERQRAAARRHGRDSLRRASVDDEYSTTLRSILRNRGLRDAHESTPPRLQHRGPVKSVHATSTDGTLGPNVRSPTGLGFSRLDVPLTVESTESPFSPEYESSSSSPTEGSPETTPEPLVGSDYSTSAREVPSSIGPNWGLDGFDFEEDELSKMRRRSQRLYPPEPRTESEKKKGLMELFSEPSPEGLKQSDESRLAIEQKKQREATRVAEEKRLAAERAKKAAEERAHKELQERLAKSGGLRLPKKQLIGPISADWTQRALNTLRASAAASLATTGEGVDLRQHDFGKVVPETEWLNDEIVNGSLNWLDQAINSAAGIKNVKTQTRKCLAMSSFFFRRIKEKGVAGTARTLSRMGVKKDNLLSVDTILVPICESMHWTLLVIRPSRKTVAHMDSLNPRGSTANTSLGLAWMKEVLGEKFVPDEWTVVRHDAPRQTNGWDCGVHTITNAMCVGLGLSPIDSYSASDMPRQRLRIACILLNGGFKGDFDLQVY